ncbi:hypothetical protein JCM10908_002826 [Rhodotorula pacifica]|uniref:alpha/beta fold hydrolase n=1 Tax=Rhodotorula pacifica TaxID=1495444 RepID=UPI00317351C1
MLSDEAASLPARHSAGRSSSRHTIRSERTALPPESSLESLAESYKTAAELLSLHELSTDEAEGSDPGIRTSNRRDIPPSTPRRPTEASPRRHRKISGSRDLTGAPDEIRQAALRAWDRPWMAALAAKNAEGGGEGVGTKSVDEMIAQLKAQRFRAPMLPNHTTPGTKGEGTAIPRIPASSPATPQRQNRRSAPLHSPSTPSSSPLPYVPYPTTPQQLSPSPTSPSASCSRPKTIEEIIAEHAPAVLATSQSPPSSRARNVSQTSRTSSELLRDEIRLVADARLLHALEHGQLLSGGSITATDGGSPRPPARSGGESVESTPRLAAPSDADGHAHPPSLATTERVTPNPASEAGSELAQVIRSPRLTRIATLRHPPHSGLQVSYADVGDPAGHPVIVSLGLTSVRYLVALFDELATALGLRIICFDRWGLGRTTAVPDSQRGFAQWAQVVEELVSPSQLDLPTFSILAHSAGAPYAVATALLPSLAPRIRGSIHFLAPWVVTPSAGDSLAGVYKLLKYVPSGVIKSAQQAEWKVQSWRLGKPPTPTSPKALPVGYDARSAGVGRSASPLSSATPSREAEETTRATASPGTPTQPRAQPQLQQQKRGSLAGSLTGLFSQSPSKSSATRPSSSSSSLSSPSARSRRFSFLTSSSPRRERPPSSSTGSTVSGTARQLSSVAETTTTRNGTSTGAPQQPGLQASPTDALLSSSSPPPLQRDSSASTLASSAKLSSPGPSSSATTSPGRPFSLASSFREDDIPASSPAIPPSVLIDGLLRASHAESLSGSTSDLLVLLERGGSAPSSSLLDYQAFVQPVKVWYGTKDDRISYASIKWLEEQVELGAKSRCAAGQSAREKACKITLVERAGHSLMADGAVMYDVLESLATECNTKSTY